MSDIDINVPIWIWPVLLLVSGVWVLTACAALAGIWLYYRRHSVVVRVIAGVVIGLWVISAGINLYSWVMDRQGAARSAAELRSRQRTLAETTTIAGIRLPPGTLVTVPWDPGNGPIDSADLPVPATIQGVPVKGHVEFKGGKLDGDVSLARNAWIGGVPCSAKATVNFYYGDLSACTLFQPALLRGVPCRGPVNVYVNLECDLAANYSRFGYVWPAGTRYEEASGTAVSFIIGASPPDLYPFGEPMVPGSGVDFERGQLASVTFGGKTFNVRGCIITGLQVKDGRVLGLTGAPCAAANAAFDTISLPGDPLQKR